MGMGFAPTWLRQVSPAASQNHFNYWLMLTNPRDAFSGQSRSPNIVIFHMLGIVSSCAIVNLSFRGAVFTIFDFKKERMGLPIDVL